MTSLKNYRSLLLLLCILVPCISRSSLNASTDPNNPNYLLIIIDQFRYDMIRAVQDQMPRFDGKTKVRTPNMDRLLNEGAYFKNGYTQCAVCGPARGVLRTGKTLENNGIQSNGFTEDDRYPLSPWYGNRIVANHTIDQILIGEKGFVADFFGKWHMPEIWNYSQDGLTRYMQFNDADFTGMKHDEDYESLIFIFNDSGDSSFQYAERLAQIADGLDPVQYPGMQRNTYSDFPYVTDAIDSRYGQAPYSTDNPRQPDQRGRNTLPVNRTSSYFEGTAAAAALDRLAGNDERFMLTASYHSPHGPMVAAGMFYDYYDSLQDNFFVPPNIDFDDSNTPYGKDNDTDYQDPVKVKEWMVSYFGLCEEVDIYIGKLMDILDKHGVADNTLIVLTADHGEALGYHGRRSKSTFFEESAHVPFLIKFPGRIPAGITIEEDVTTLDLFATALDYLGADEFDNSDGKSLRLFIEGQSYNENYDEAAIVTEWDHRSPDEVTGLLDRSLGGETNFMSKKGPWKLMMTKNSTSTRTDMLYDMESDPYEMSNLIGDNGMTASDEVIGKAEHLKALLVEWMQRMDDAGGSYSDPAANDGVGMGDIAEVSARRQWRTVDIWVSDTDVEIGVPVDVGGQLTRNEYIYLGRTNSGTLTVNNITVQGADAGLIQLSDFTSGGITAGNYERVKVTYLPSFQGQQISDARIVINHNQGADRIINLSSKVALNIPPQYTSAPIKTADLNTLYSYTVTANDNENDPISYSSVNIPSWLTFNNVSRTLSGIPSTGDIGAHSVSLRVSDGSDINDQNFTVTVSNVGNDAPVIETEPNTGANENSLYSYTITAIDPEGDNLTYSTVTVPSWLTFDAATRLLTGSPSAADVGSEVITLSVSDGVNAVEQSWNMTVFNQPQVDPVKNGNFELVGGGYPVYWSPGSTASSSSEEAYEGTHSLKITTNPSSTKQSISLVPNTLYNISCWVLADQLTAGRISFDTSDKFDSPSQNPGGYAQFSVDPGDADVWTEFTGYFNSAGETTATIRFYGSSMVGTVYFDNLTITPVTSGGSQGPAITSIAITEAQTGVPYHYALTAWDPNQDALLYNEVTVPSWLTFDAIAGILSGTPGNGNVGTHPVTIEVSDGVHTSQQSFNINVISSNGAPQLTSNPSEYVEVSSPYSYLLTANDPEGDPMTFSQVNVPSWLSFNAGSGLLSGTPQAGDIGAHPVTLRVSDGISNVDDSFIINVSAIGNDAPVVSSTPITGVIEGAAYNYTINASDPDGDALSYGVSGLPGWLSFNSGNRTLSGTPTSTDLGLNEVNLSVSDGASSVWQSFNIAVFATPLPGNLVENGSFELGGSNPDSWNMGNNSVGSTEEAYDGSSSLKVSGGSSNNSQTIAIQPGTDYELSLWVLTSNMTANNIHFDTQDVFDPGKIPGGTCQFNIDIGDADVWTQFTGNFNSATETSVTIRTYGSDMVGDVYFDNIVLRPIGGGNQTPVITSLAIDTVDVGNLYSYVVSGADAEGDVLSFSEVNTPSWLSFDVGTGILSGIPGAGDVGPHSITLRVSDGTSTSDQNFTIAVNQTIDNNSDDDNDGIPYIMEYALDGDPNSADSDLILPQVVEQASSFDFSFKRAQSDITYKIQKSTDLVNWTDHVTINDSHGTVGNTATVSVPDTEMSNGKLFLRLYVEN